MGLFALLVLSGQNATAVESKVKKEDKIKAAFLYNFTKFVEWPATRFTGETTPIVIGVLGRNPFGEELEKIVEGRVVNGRPILVKLVNTAEEISTVHLLFVPADEESRLPGAAWRDIPVIVVGESAGFAALGGTIRFVQADDKVRFEINIAAAERCGVKISAQLQKLATAVRREP